MSKNKKQITCYICGKPIVNEPRSNPMTKDNGDLSDDMQPGETRTFKLVEVENATALPPQRSGRR